MFNSFYKNKKVLVTGHTGFKGSWITEWLLNMGAKVSGIALEPNTEPCLFNILKLKDRVEHNIIDIRNKSQLSDCIQRFSPEIVFHMAAQPLVRLSYEEPTLTWETNVMGTVNVLESVKECNSVKSCVVITTDKCYENQEWHWGYRENDALGGHDPYSASKGAAEIVVASYRKSFFNNENTSRLVSVRAGNVIGGGDWSKDRIVVDFVQSIERGEPVRLRNPKATRPWQHVLEPLSGYLLVGQKIYENEKYAQAWNFGPRDESVVEVEQLANKLVDSWKKGAVELVGNNDQPHEAGLLKLDCSKAKSLLNWEPVWGIDETVEKTVKWYSAFYDKSEMLSVTKKQIEKYQKDAHERKMCWAN